MFASSLKKKCTASVSRRREDKQRAALTLYHKRAVPQRKLERILNALVSRDRISPCFSLICRGAGRTSVSRSLSTQGTKGGQRLE